MKTVTLLLSLSIVVVCACDDLSSIEKKHKLPSEAKFLFNEGDTLVYQSGTLLEKYTIIEMVNGKYSEYRSGTCGKGARDIIDFQLIRIRAIDSTQQLYYHTRPEIDDCDGPPRVDTRFICIIKNLVNTFHSLGISYDSKLNWYNSFSDLESNYTAFHESVTINGKQYRGVYEYDIPQTPNARVDVLYYTMHYGFVGYRLRSGELFNLIEPVVK